MRYWDPLEDFEDIFNAFWGRPKRQLLPHGKGKSKLAPYRSPVTDLSETDKSVIARMEIPGVNKEDIDLKVNDDKIEVKVEQKEETEDEDKEKGYYRYESRCKSFYRSIPLPTEVNADKAEAEYKNGVLTVEIPKKEPQKIEEKTKKIEIK